MQQFVYTLRRKDGMSLEAFQTYWRSNHGPKVASVAAVLGIKRYVQVHTTAASRPQRPDALRGAMAEPCDGVAELWIDAAAATGTDAEKAAAAQMLRDDEAEFISFSESSFWYGDEHVFVGKQTPA